MTISARSWQITKPIEHVVSLVPSLIEAIAVTAPQLLVGATDWCTHPAYPAVTRVRGTKNPDIAAVVALAPDLVVANDEKNRGDDIGALRAAGLAVWVTAPRTLDAAAHWLGCFRPVVCPDRTGAARRRSRLRR